MAIPARLRAALGDFLLRNGNLLTISTVAAIIIGGVTVVSDPSRWWVGLLAVGVLSLLALLLVNAKVIVKATVATALVILEAGWAFQVGVTVDPTATGALLWMMMTLTTYFACLTLSYLLPSLASRWTTSLLATTFGFLLTHALLFALIPPIPGVAGACASSLLIFLALSRFGSRSLYRRKHFPQLSQDGDLLEAMRQGLLQSGWGASVVGRRRRRALLAWDERHAFVLTVVELEQKFGMVGRRRFHLSYKGRGLSPWLLDTHRRLVPFWRTKGAPLLLVLLDERNRNGVRGELVGVDLPDTAKKLPVGVYPASGFLARRAWGSMMKELVATYGEVLPELTPRQVKALDYTLPKEEKSSPGEKPAEGKPHSA